MTNLAAAPETGTFLPIAFQYTIEAYKVFQKLSEVLPNPMAASMFAGFATDERRQRDLLEIRYGSTQGRMQATLGNDLRFLEIVEGDLSSREAVELLIARERTMEKKLNEEAKSAPASERNLYHYLSAAKRAHLAYLERELEMIKRYPDWFKREDAEDVVVHGETTGA